MFIQGRFDNKEMSGIHVWPSYNASAVTRYYFLIRLAPFFSFAFHTHLRCSNKLDRWNECKQPTSLNYCSLWKYCRNVHVNSRNFSTPRGRFEPLHLLPFVLKIHFSEDVKVFHPMNGFLWLSDAWYFFLEFQYCFIDFLTRLLDIWNDLWNQNIEFHAEN